MNRSRQDGTHGWRRWWLLASTVILVILGAAMLRQLRPPGAASADERPVRRGSDAASRPGSVQRASRTAASDAPASEGANHSAAGSIPQVVAVVNGQSITRQELAAECLRRHGPNVLESLVNKYLILQACQQRAIQITYQDIEAEIERIARRFSLSQDRWLSLLESERQISPEQYRRDIIWPTLALRRLASDRLQITPEQLAEAFESEYGPKVQVRVIACKMEAKAQQLLARARAKPEDFGRLAKDESEDPHSAAARGLIPPISKHAGSPEIEQAAFALKPGEISPVIHAADQYLILKCERHIPAAHIAPQFRKAAEDRLRERIVEQRLRESAGEIFQQLQKNAQVVNVYNDPQLRQQMPGVAATINGQKITLAQLGEECLLRHAKNVLDAEINYRLLQQALDQRKLQVTKQDLDQEIGRAAESYGYLNGDQPNIEQWLKDVTSQEGLTVEVYVRDAVWPSAALKKLVGDTIPITQEDLQKGFEANYGERVEVLAIVLGNQRVAQEVWAMARGNPTREFFGELASQYSIEPISRANYGQVPPLRRHSGQPLLEKEAFSLKPGELSGIIASGDKYILLYCLGRTRPVVEQLADVETELRKDIHEKKVRLAMAELFDRLKENAQIDNFLTRTSQTGKPSGPEGPAPGVSRNAPTPGRERLKG